MKTAALFLGIAALMGLCILTLIGGFLWNLTGEVYDDVTGNWKRAKQRALP
jgi:nitrogen fixation-related uncharacterized protein